MAHQGMEAQRVAVPTGHESTARTEISDEHMLHTDIADNCRR